ncbi:MAG: VOC family protein [Pyrinomonadaceae bacterium]
MSNNEMNDHTLRPIDSRVRIGHVHLKVADLERAIQFYCGVLGFELMQRYGRQAAFIAAGDYHHHIGLNTWESFGGSPPRAGTTGLYHLAILYPTRAALADALRRLINHKFRLMVPAITASAKPSICATRMITASNYTATAHQKIGLAMRMGNSLCIRSSLI